MPEITDNGSICMLPWLHIYALADGRAYPCCMAEWDHSVGNLNDQTLQEVWNGPAMRQLRLDMLAGTKSDVCNRCYTIESSGLGSSRTRNLQRYAHHSQLLDDTAADGSAPLHLVHMDIRFSNICNLTCRMCNPVSSSAWFDDAQRVFPDPPSKRFLRINANGELMRQLEPYLDEVELASFAGGEPLLMDEHYQLLEHWLRTGRSDVELNYRTNFTTLRYKDKDLFDLWNRFAKVQVGASLDANHARGEYLRHGTVWPDIVRNRREMQQRCPGVKFEIAATVSAFNCFNICDFHEEWIRQGLVIMDNLELNPLISPSKQSIKVLPDDIKQAVARRIDLHMQWLRDMGGSTRMVDQFDSIKRFMFSDDHSHLLPDLRRFTASLDQLRGQHAATVFPELAEIFSS